MRVIGVLSRPGGGTIFGARPASHRQRDPPTGSPDPMTKVHGLASLALVVLLGFAPAWSAEPPATREAVCRWAATPPAIDGKLGDPVWESAAVIEHFPSFWKGADNGTTTRARLLWDNDALYFAATMTDAELKAFGTKRNDRLWLGDVFELFFKPSDGRPEFYEFQVNPKSVILELPFPKRDATAFARLAALPPSGYKAAATLDGTLDQPGDRDHGWAVEGRIPWTAFAPTGGRPAAGSIWRFALCRYDYGPEGTEPVLMSSAPLREPNFHRYEDYGRLRFEGPRR
jgi:hypothetical protein